MNWISYGFCTWACERNVDSGDSSRFSRGSQESDESQSDARLESGQANSITDDSSRGERWPVEVGQWRGGIADAFSGWPQNTRQSACSEFSSRTGTRCRRDRSCQWDSETGACEDLGSAGQSGGHAGSDCLHTAMDELRSLLVGFVGAHQAEMPALLLEVAELRGQNADLSSALLAQADTIRDATHNACASPGSTTGCDYRSARGQRGRPLHRNQPRATGGGVIGTDARGTGVGPGGARG